MIKKPIHFISLLICLALLAPQYASAEIIDRIVARVNNDIVTLHDVEQAAIPFLLQSGRNPAVLQNPSQRDRILEEALEELVDRKLIVQEAKKIDYTISDDELEQWLNYTRQQQNLSEEQFAQVIEQYGMSYKDYREMVRQNLLKVRMIKIKVGSQVTITEDDINARYREKYGDGPTKTRFITVRHVLLRPKDESDAAGRQAADRLRQLRKEIMAGKSFEEAARETSEGPSADKGGLIGTFKRGDLDPSFESAAFALEVGEVSKVVQTKFGYHLIKVEEQELREAPDTGDRREAIRNEIQQEEMNRLLKQYISELRSKAFVEIKY